MKLFSVIPQQVLRKLVYGFVGIAGLSIIWRNLAKSSPVPAGPDPSTSRRIA